MRSDKAPDGSVFVVVDGIAVGACLRFDRATHGWLPRDSKIWWACYVNGVMIHHPRRLKPTRREAVKAVIKHVFGEKGLQ